MTISESGDVSWSNFIQHKKEQLDNIQNEAVVSVTGTNKLISIPALNSETGWETLSERRYEYGLITLFSRKNRPTRVCMFLSLAKGNIIQSFGPCGTITYLSMTVTNRV